MKRWLAKGPSLLLFLHYERALVKTGMIALLIVFASLALSDWRISRIPDQERSTVGIMGLMPAMGASIRNSIDDLIPREVAMLSWSMNVLLLGHRLRLRQNNGRSTG